MADEAANGARLPGSVLLRHDARMFVLFHDREGRHLLTVAAGGVVMTDVTIELTVQEAGDLAGDEAKAVTLARQVATRTSVFEERRIRPAIWPDAA
ncbi:MAG: hypothetical protein DI530_08865 [Sphingomonas sp.]|nr:MAG: hypothetical protein DI530_08865 [Sphingomonas sp.]